VVLYQMVGDCVCVVMNGIDLLCPTWWDYRTTGKLLAGRTSCLTWTAAEQLASRLGIRLESRHERILEERLDILKDRVYCLT